MQATLKKVLATICAFHMVSCGVDTKPLPPRKEAAESAANAKDPDDGTYGSYEETNEPEATYEIRGRYLNDAGEPIPGKTVYIQQSQYAPMDDFTDAKVHTLGELGQAVGMAVLFLIFLPFSLFVDCSGSSDDSSDATSAREASERRLISEVSTDPEGYFSATIAASSIPKDFAGERNIIVVTETNDGNLGKAVLTLDDEVVDVGSLRECNIDLTAQDSGPSVMVHWQNPEVIVEKYNIYAIRNDGSYPFWVDSSIDSPGMALALPKSIFKADNSRIFVEGYYERSEKRLLSCVSSVEVKTENRPESLTVNAMAYVGAESVPVDSITNNSFADKDLFLDYQAKSVVVDLMSAKEIKELVFHNLSLRDADGKVGVSIQLPSGEWQRVGTEDARRFFYMKLATPAVAQKIKLDFSSDLAELTELGVY
ncbi:MAG: hypothetical protein AB7T49_18605 [Oligoflexales bacterium]